MANKYFFTKDPARYLALVANNEMKNPLVGFVQSHVKKINMLPLVAKGTTGELLYKEAKYSSDGKSKIWPFGVEIKRSAK